MFCGISSVFFTFCRFRQSLLQNTYCTSHVMRVKGEITCFTQYLSNVAYFRPHHHFACVEGHRQVARVQYVKPLYKHHIGSTEVALHQIVGNNVIAEFDALQPIVYCMNQASNKLYRIPCVKCLTIEAWHQEENRIVKRPLHIQHEIPLLLITEPTKAQHNLLVCRKVQTLSSFCLRDVEAI